MNTGALKDLVMNNGQKIPAFGLGTYAMEENLGHVVKAAVGMGCRLIDTAFIYKNEIAIGNALRDLFHEGKSRREDVFVVSKLWNTKHEPKNVLPAIQNSLQALQLDYLDLYLIHWPFAMKPGREEDDDDVMKNIYYPEDTSVQVEETWRAMEQLVHRGYVRSIGLSNFNSVQIERILKIATIKPVVNQVECHAYFSQEKLRTYCKQMNILVMGYSPLCGLQGTSSDTHDLNLLAEPTIEELTSRYKKNAVQIVLRYLVQCEVIPIPKTSKLEHLKSNFDIQDFTIAPDDFEKMRALDKNRRYLDFSTTKTFKEYPFNLEF